ncbi:RiPP maturation radical SAM C-methyltransferase [Candidatus Binatia bacterium]|nr:RiPP maturation radical SAM C-methyltransferase [Candidatus Binatia bacterium]
MDVCLVNMPLASLSRPSIALGVLKPMLARAGIAARVLYANLWWVEYVGARHYATFLAPRTEECLIDWLFAGAAFPDFAPDHDAFLDMLFINHPDLFGEGEPAGRALLLELRAQMPDFVDWTARRVLEHEPRIVGCTSTFQQHVASLALLRRIRELDPSVATLLGGANCETVMGRTTHASFPWVDYVVSGEADGLIGDLCAAILRHGSDVPRDLLPPAVFAPAHRRDGYPRVDSGDGYARGTTADLSTVPAPDYDEYFFDEVHRFLYRDFVRPGLPYEASRGCWWGAKSHCTFCGLNGGGMAFRSKPAEQVIAEIDGLVDRYGSRRISTVDNIIDVKYFDSVLPHFAAAERKLNIFFETKANLKKSQVERFKRSGVNWIQPGIESMHSECLRLMRKGVAAWQNVRLLKWCRQYGVFAFWNVIAGFPGERDEWYAEMASWLPLIEHFQPGTFSQLRFDRYSPYFTRAADYGLALRPCRQYAHVYPLSPQDLADQAYFFTEPELALVKHLPERPGTRAVLDLMTRWKPHWPQLRKLELVHDGEATFVLDTRSCAKRERHPVDATDLLLLDACDAAIGDAELSDAVQAHGLAADDVAAHLAALLDAGLILRLDGRLLSLVLDRPEAYAPGIEFPGGSWLYRNRSAEHAADRDANADDALDPVQGA